MDKSDRELMTRLSEEARFTPAGELAAMKTFSEVLNKPVWYVIKEPVELPDDDIIVVWLDEIDLLEQAGWDTDQLVMWKIQHPRQQITEVNLTRH